MSVSTKAYNFSEVLIFGQGRTASSIATSLSLSGAKVSLLTDDLEQNKKRVKQHLKDFLQHCSDVPTGSVNVLENTLNNHKPSLVIITGYYDIALIQSIIRHLEERYSHELIITVATDHIPLANLQEKANRPERILVVNWTEPAHTTSFLEIVHNETNDPGIVSWLEKIGKEQWGKDPY